MGCYEMEIGERIRQTRKSKGITQEDLAKLINKSPQVISNWERGYTSTISHDDIKKLCLALGVSADHLLEIPKPLRENDVLEQDTSNNDKILKAKISASTSIKDSQKTSSELVDLIREVIHEELKKKS